MSAFEFYLAFYGLLLGLTVAQVAGGFLNAIDARQEVRIGWLTPSLAIFVFFDITSLWIYVWGIRDSVAVNWGTMFGVLVVALTYYIAAGLIFPRNITDWPVTSARVKHEFTSGFLNSVWLEYSASK